MKPYIWALMTALVWGCVPVLEKLGLAKMPVLVGIFYRSFGVIIGMMLIVFFKFNLLKESLANIPFGVFYLVVGGFLASVVGQIMFYHALQGGEASKVVPLAASYPLISFLIGAIFLGESVTAAKLGGLFFIILGVILLK
ncbi:MAG: EamA family transporter [Candidatus Omnitrophota bacterium]